MHKCFFCVKQEGCAPYWTFIKITQKSECTNVSEMTAVLFRVPE